MVIRLLLNRHRRLLLNSPEYDTRIEIERVPATVHLEKKGVDLLSQFSLIPILLTDLLLKEYEKNMGQRAIVSNIRNNCSLTRFLLSPWKN